MTGPRTSTLDTVDLLDIYGQWENVRSFANDTGTNYETMKKRVYRMAKKGLVETRVESGQLYVRPNPHWGGQEAPDGQ